MNGLETSEKPKQGPCTQSKGTVEVEVKIW